MEILNLKVNTKNTNRCSDCPGRNDEEGCMWWWEWVETNTSNGQERLRKQCGKQAMQVFMVEVIKASNRPAAAVESTRNEIVKGFDRLASLAVATGVDETKKGIRATMKRMLKG